jgi:hypothetical protein
MDVVRHQNIGVHVESMTLAITLQKILVLGVVAGIAEASALMVSAGYDMK